MEASAKEVGERKPWSVKRTYKFVRKGVYEGEFRDGKPWTGKLYHPAAEDRTQKNRDV